MPTLRTPGSRSVVSESGAVEVEAGASVDAVGGLVVTVVLVVEAVVVGAIVAVVAAVGSVVVVSAVELHPDAAMQSAVVTTTASVVRPFRLIGASGRDP